MALTSTVYKLRVALSHIDHNRYETLNLTLAQHPSESLERMMVRVLAFCMNAGDDLAFCKGVSTPEEPDIWRRAPGGQLELWIDVGEPGAERIKKACRTAAQVRVYSFNAKSGAWWKQVSEDFAQRPVEVFRFPWEQVRALAALITQRSMDLSVTLTGDTAYIAAETGDCVVVAETLQQP